MTNRRINSLYIGILIIFLSCSSVPQASQAPQVAPPKLPPMVKKFKIPKLKIIKMKLYQHDTIAIIWYDFTGDGQCNYAKLIEKIDDYFIAKKMPCDQADEIDAYILESNI